MEFKFAKLNGLGNNFILMSDLTDDISGKADVSRLAKAVCDVSFGIGADGLILVKSSRNCDFRMVIINSDGSEAEMCGNGIRCMVRFLVDNQLTRKDTLCIETLAGPIHTVHKGRNMVEVDMGPPAFRSDDIVLNDDSNGQDAPAAVEIGGTPFRFVSMGNPHAVTFVESFDFDWAATGAAIEKTMSVFPNRVNVEFGRVENDGEMTMKVWERGCGVTQACGTGTCALVVAAVHAQKVSAGDVRVHLPGGDLLIQYFEGSTVRMTGPAEHVCSGVYVYSETE